MNLIDLFDADSSADWTNDGSSTYARDAANGELDGSGWDNDARLRYSANPPGNIEHEVQVTCLTNASTRAVMCGARMYGAGDDGYGIYVAGGAVTLCRFNGGTRTNLQEWLSQYTAGNFITVRMACEGGDGANVAISIWIQDHGASKPSDPGWIGSEGSPTQTHTDTDATRLDDSSQHLDVGFVGRGPAAAGHDPRLDFWRGRAISDRGGAAPTNDALLVIRRST